MTLENMHAPNNCVCVCECVCVWCGVLCVCECVWHVVWCFLNVLCQGQDDCPFSRVSLGNPVSDDKHTSQLCCSTTWVGQYIYWLLFQWRISIHDSRISDVVNMSIKQASEQVFYINNVQKYISIDDCKHVPVCDLAWGVVCSASARADVTLYVGVKKVYY